MTDEKFYAYQEHLGKNSGQFLKAKTEEAAQKEAMRVFSDAVAGTKLCLCLVESGQLTPVSEVTLSGNYWRIVK